MESYEEHELIVNEECDGVYRNISEIHFHYEEAHYSNHNQSWRRSCPIRKDIHHQIPEYSKPDGRMKHTLKIIETESFRNSNGRVSKMQYVKYV